MRLLVFDELCQLFHAELIMPYTLSEGTFNNIVQVFIAENCCDSLYHHHTTCFGVTILMLDGVKSCFSVIFRFPYQIKLTKRN